MCYIPVGFGLSYLFSNTIHKYHRLLHSLQSLQQRINFAKLRIDVDMRMSL